MTASRPQVADLRQTRDDVVEALRALADEHHQRTRWGRYEPGVNYYDDLDLNVHILYDDTGVLPRPEDAVPQLLHEHEVPPLRLLHAALAPMLDDLGARADEVYLADPRWGRVTGAARAALAAMQAQRAERRDPGGST